MFFIRAVYFLRELKVLDCLTFPIGKPLCAGLAWLRILEYSVLMVFFTAELFRVVSPPHTISWGALALNHSFFLSQLMKICYSSVDFCTQLMLFGVRLCFHPVVDQSYRNLSYFFIEHCCLLRIRSWLEILIA